MGAFSRTGPTRAVALAALLSSAAWGAATAQTVTLPEVNVTDTRLTGIGRSVGTGGETAPAGPPDGAPSGTVGGIAVGGAGITGASTTVITGEDIER